MSKFFLYTSNLDSYEKHDENVRSAWRKQLFTGSVQIVFLKDITRFIEKKLSCWSIFCKVAACRLEGLKTLAQVVFCQVCKTFKSTNFVEPLQMAVLEGLTNFRTLRNSALVLNIDDIPSKSNVWPRGFCQWPLCFTF